MVSTTTDTLIYHAYSKSIAGYKIFTCEAEYERIKNAISFYQVSEPPCNYSQFLALKGSLENLDIAPETTLVNILAYCVMPTHLHLLLAENQEHGISKYMHRLLGSYARYFNLRHKRKGYLWESHYKTTKITSEELLLHVSRYIHLNPVTAYLVEKPELWHASSYNEALGETRDLIIRPETFITYSEGYQEFVEDGIENQRALAHIKEFLADEE